MVTVKCIGKMMPNNYILLSRAIDVLLMSSVFCVREISGGGECSHRTSTKKQMMCKYIDTKHALFVKAQSPLNHYTCSGNFLVFLVDICSNCLHSHRSLLGIHSYI